MRFKLLLIFATVFLTSVVKAQKTYIPDANFEQKLIDLSYDDVLDDSVLTANIDTVTILELEQLFIYDLTGIEDFASLELLDCNTNQLTDIDVSQNAMLKTLICNDNYLSTLEISNNINLNELQGYNNELTTLSLPNSSSLEHINVENNELTAIDISNNLNLNHINLDKNDLTSLDISNNVALKELSCYYNNIAEIDLSNNLNLRFFGLSFSDITDIDLSNNTQLDALGIEVTDLVHLNLSDNINLKNVLLVNNHDLISVDLANDHNDSLEMVYVSDSPALICVQVDDTTNLDSDIWLVPQPILLPHSILSEDCENIIGLEEEIENSFELSPNPTSNLINVELEKRVSYKIYSILGKDVLQVGVLQKGNNILDLAYLDNGMYIIQITNEQGLTTTKKIIKQ